MPFVTSRASCRLLVCASFALAGTPAAAQPVHHAWSFTANAATTGDQLWPAVALDPGGNFVVVWQAIDGASNVVYARRFDVRARPRGLEFAVHAPTAAQRQPAVALDPRGRFVVAWQEDDADGSGSAIVARRFDAQGVPRGPAFLVNTHTTGEQTMPAVAVDGAGRTLVAWESSSPGGGTIVARRYDAAGDPIDGEFVVPAVSGGQDRPAVASGADGRFVVAWRGPAPPPSSGDAIFARRFDAGGAPIGAEVRVDTAVSLSTRGPDLAAAADGSFVVVWRANQFVSGRSFDASGVPRGAPFTVAFFPTGGPFVPPAVAADSGGRFVVSWEVRNGVDPGYGLIARQYEADGTPRDAGFQATWVTAGDQRAPAIAADAIGNFVVVSTSDHVDSVTDDVVGQTFGALFGSRLRVDALATATADGNQVLEPGEWVKMHPTWRSESFWRSSGSLITHVTSYTGPPGPAYTFDPTFNAYGPYFGVPGDEDECFHCPSVGVSAPAARPVLHWDTFATEEVDEPDQHQRKTWALHVGDSFSDMPRANPFYRFVETLLHHGVTAGCGGGAYCPLGSTTRAQMAVFVLVAKEGPAYVPRACGATPVFADVPPGDPFCRWIEELARRGVVGGCGGGNYCPTFAVSREQMAVFVLRTLDAALIPAACTVDPYSDVPATSPFCRWIRDLTARGVVAGCGGGNYCPAMAVSREQMGVFIAVTFGLFLYGP